MRRQAEGAEPPLEPRTGPIGNLTHLSKPLPELGPGEAHFSSSLSLVQYYQHEHLRPQASALHYPTSV